MAKTEVWAPAPRRRQSTLSPADLPARILSAVIRAEPLSPTLDRFLRPLICGPVQCSNLCGRRWPKRRSPADRERL